MTNDDQTPQHPGPTSLGSPTHGGPEGPESRWAKIGVLRPLRVRDFRLLWTGETVSLLGDGIYLVALAWLVYDLTNAPTALSAVLLAWSLPQIFFFLVGGVISDRFERRRVMMIANAIRMVTMATIGFLAITGVVELWHLWVLMAITGIGDSLFMPAFQAIVPDVVPDDMLVEANSLGGLVRPAAVQLLGPAVGGLLVGAVGSGPAFAINSVTFAVSYVTLWLMSPYPVTKQDSDQKASAVAEIREGFAFVRAHAWLWATLFSAAVSLLVFIGPLEVVVPFIVKNELNGDASAYGLLLASGGVGAIFGSIVMGQRGLPAKHITFMYAIWGLGIFLLAGYAFFDHVWQAMIVQCVIGGCFSTGMIVWMTLMHRLVPRELLGRVSSLDWLVSTCLVPVSFGLAGPVAVAIGPKTTMLWGGLIGSALCVGALFIPGVRDTERSGALGTGVPDEPSREPAAV